MTTADDKAAQCEAVRLAAEDVVNALDELLRTIRNSPLEGALRHWPSADVGRAPYELRNMLADLEGVDGGWLQARGEAFREQVDTLILFAEDAYYEADDPDFGPSRIESREDDARREQAAEEAPTGRNPKHPDVQVELTGHDGNASGIIAAVSRALKRAGYGAEVEAFQTEATSGDYDNVLVTAMQWVEVS